MAAETWAAPDATFSGFAREDSWRAAIATIALFQRLATEVADGFAYPADRHERTAALIRHLRPSASPA
jgi:hypothetical protein